MNKEERLRAQAAHNIPCFIQECPLHETCLHWLTGQYYGGETHIVTCVNPYYPTVNSLQCSMYQKDDIVKYAVGMMHIFDDVPFPIARATKKRLINLFSRKRFYEYRNGVRPIPPYEQQKIARVFQEEGWQGEIRYDGWKEDYLW
jgi:hypothetical protein